MQEAVPELYRVPGSARAIAVIASSFQRLLGRALVKPGDDVVAALWAAPCAIVAHGVEADPVFFFGNRVALEIFERGVEDFTRLPSRLSAEAPLWGEREAFLERVRRDGYIDDYSGIRISATGKRFEIRQAVVWNLLDAAGIRQGQAAMFPDWRELVS